MAAAKTPAVPAAARIRRGGRARHGRPSGQSRPDPRKASRQKRNRKLRTPSPRTRRRRRIAFDTAARAPISARRALYSSVLRSGNPRAAAAFSASPPRVRMRARRLFRRSEIPRPDRAFFDERIQHAIHPANADPGRSGRLAPRHFRIIPRETGHPETRVLPKLAALAGDAEFSQATAPEPPAGHLPYV